MSVIADQLQQVGGPTNLLVAIGNVEIVRGGTRLLADRVELNRDTGEAIAQGKVVFFDGQDRLVGDRIDYNLGPAPVSSTTAPPSRAVLLASAPTGWTGWARAIYEVQGAIFTTCEGDTPHWSFRVGAGIADLNDIVYGRDASFWVGKVPLLPWIPFFAAALRRERQSGFLFPQVGVSSRKGYFAKIPYFWAIDDSQDLTVSLDIYTDRGIGATAEYRYILSQESAGAFSGFMISEIFKDNDTRGAGELQARLADHAPAVRQGRRQRGERRQPAPRVRRPAGRPDPAARGDQCVRLPELGPMEPRGQHPLVPGLDDEPPGRASARPRHPSRGADVSPYPDCPASSTRCARGPPTSCATSAPRGRGSISIPGSTGPFPWPGSSPSRPSRAGARRTTASGWSTSARSPRSGRAISSRRRWTTTTSGCRSRAAWRWNPASRACGRWTARGGLPPCST